MTQAQREYNKYCKVNNIPGYKGVKSAFTLRPCVITDLGNCTKSCELKGCGNDKSSHNARR